MQAADIIYSTQKEFILSVVSEEFEDIKGVIRRTDNTMTTRKSTK